ncbi:phage terminase large subunit family protein [Methanobrevibacter filiformis]|uniref:Terminase-like family protein n=1 Tax=Methanobrevibacter filiformis TaxID=55758 RepID=A0A166FFR7_9EURY|nr:hypothetical protein [Methanobrevibacter filiformis]KZX17631.1 terminase-like family protein [Methanobrevibacter filiformis]
MKAKAEDIPSDPGSFAMWASEGTWQPSKHLILIIELLLYVIQGRLSRLMIFMPPRHGKSLLVSHYFLTWFLGHFPDKRVILATHSANFSRRWGRRARNLLKKIGIDLFPVPIELAEDSTAAHQWDIKNHSGGLLTTGTGGSILGEGAHGFLIDDPTKGFKKARSKVHQEELNDWWFTEAKTRLDTDIATGIKPWVVGIWQRLNVQDLAGQILETEPQISFKEAIEILRNGGSIPYGTWVICNTPAIAKENDVLGRDKGEALWSDKVPIEELKAIKKQMGSFRFEAVYQGEPKTPDGDVFKRIWFSKSRIAKEEIIKLTEELPKLRYWDFAASGEDGDATAGLLSSWDGEYLYFIKLKHAKLSPKAVITTFEQTSIHDTKKTIIQIEQEPGGMSKLLIQKFRQIKELKGFRILPDKVSKAGDKLTRSFDLQALAEDDKIQISDDIFDEIVDELCEFTGEDGGVDNITDTATGSARYWLKPKRRRIV